MRVLHLGKYWHKDGGIETHVKTLCKSLASAGVDVVNLVSSIDRQGSQFETNGYTVVESPTLGVYFSTSIAPRMIREAKRLSARQVFDVIHLHFPDPMSHLVSMALPAQIPRVITWHSDVVKQHHLLRLYRPFQSREVMRAKAIVAATQSHFANSIQIPAHYPQKQKHIIPYGLDFAWLDATSTVMANAKSLKARANGRFTVFALGRHVAYKGFEVLLQAMQQTNAYLVLGGEGPVTPHLKKLSQRLGIGGRVFFTGRLPESKLAAHYHACDVFCLPSITPNEAFGIVQLEAMACGKPVICTELNNGVSDVNQHMQTGLVVPPGNAAALAQAIERLQQSQSLRFLLGQNGKDHARDRFSVPKMLQQHLNLYAQLMADKRG